MRHKTFGFREKVNSHWLSCNILFIILQSMGFHWSLFICVFWSLFFLLCSSTHSKKWCMQSKEPFFQQSKILIKEHKLNSRDNWPLQLINQNISKSSFLHTSDTSLPASKHYINTFRIQSIKKHQPSKDLMYIETFS